MAYENFTYEAILHRMMNRVTNEYPNLDNREGSILFNALAPAAVELAIMYTELDNVLNESFVETASREYLLLSCSQMGMDISVFQANAGVHKGEFNIEVPIGSRWNCELYNYEVVEFLEMNGAYYTYRLQCEETGTAPNNVVGDLTPITDFPYNLTYAKLTECLIEGENETSDDAIREAYYDYINNVAFDGNITQYKRWCNEYEGIGNSKIIPLWNGVNTVKVSILSASNQIASEELIAEFQEHLDPNCEGMGNGVAPIGAFVTVSTATALPIDISGTIHMKYGYTDTTPINNAISKYFTEIAYNQNVVGYLNIGAIILGVDGVASVSDLTINGGTDDIELGDEEIPMLGNTTWVVG